VVESEHCLERSHASARDHDTVLRDGPGPPRLST
jgi:hypothetical protein